MRQIGNDFSSLFNDVGGWLTAGNGTQDPTSEAAVDDLAATFFGSDNTATGLFGSDMVPAAELTAPAIRARYLFNLSRIPGLANGSGRTANAIRNELKWFRKKN